MTEPCASCGAHDHNSKCPYCGLTFCAYCIAPDEHNCEFPPEEPA